MKAMVFSRRSPFTPESRGKPLGHSATWIDYNHDRWPDLYIANDFLGPDQFYRNNGDGTSPM